LQLNRTEPDFGSPIDVRNCQSLRFEPALPIGVIAIAKERNLLSIVDRCDVFDWQV
jgi:hypothetical protein